MRAVLLDFNGTLLVVSHDRYFINKLSSKIVHLTHDGSVLIDGNYDTYLQYKENHATTTVKEAKKPVVNEYKLRKEQAKEERMRKSRINKIEEEISALESIISDIENILSSPDVSANYELLLQHTEDLNNSRIKLEELYEEWESLQTE